MQLPLGSTDPSAHCPQSTHRLPHNSRSRRWQAAFPVRAATCQTSLQVLQRLTLTIQNPIPNRLYNFIQTYHLLSQISCLLALQMSVSPLSDRFLCLYSSPTHGEKYFAVTELSVFAKLGADYHSHQCLYSQPARKEDSLADTASTPKLPE